MQERAQKHYSRQTGHRLRGEADRFRRIFGFKPLTLAPEIVYLQQQALDRRRAMRRVTDSGRS